MDHTRMRDSYFLAVKKFYFPNFGARLTLCGTPSTLPNFCSTDTPQDVCLYKVSTPTLHIPEAYKLHKIPLNGKDNTKKHY